MRHRLAALTVCVLALTFGCSNEARQADHRRPRPATLRTLARARGLTIGAAVGVPKLQSDRRYRATLAREFDMVTAENAMKWDSIHPAQDTFDFTRADAIVRFARQHAMKVRGHTLMWDRQNPAWLTGGAFSRAELLRILHEHIQRVMGHYRGKVVQWDVVNEGVSDQGGLRNTFWLRGIGPEYLDLAFRWAHEADPSARLFYNDYLIEGINQKSNFVYDLVAGMKRRGVPIDGVGLQTHVNVDLKISEVERNIARLNALGLEVAITEMDVALRTPVTTDRLAAQARVYADMLRTCLAARRCHTFVMWGFTDASSWIPTSFPGLDAPLIFDRSYRPKPAYRALVAVLRGRR